MTTATTHKTNTEKQNTIVCACCLAFFPVLYLVGSTVMSFIG